MYTLRLKLSFGYQRKRSSTNWPRDCKHASSSEEILRILRPKLTCNMSNGIWHRRYLTNIIIDRNPRKQRYHIRVSSNRMYTNVRVHSRPFSYHTTTCTILCLYQRIWIVQKSSLQFCLQAKTTYSFACFVLTNTTANLVGIITSLPSINAQFRRLHPQFWSILEPPKISAENEHRS